MLVRLGRQVNRLLEPLGYEIRRVRAKALTSRKIAWYKYEAVLQEFHEYLLETVFPDLPVVDGRIELLADLHGVNIAEALWILHTLHQSLSVEGAVCEFGVAAGTMSALLANEIRAAQKTLWLFDSFQGLPKPTSKDRLIDDFWELGSIAAYEGTMSYPIESVKARLARIAFPLSRVEIVPGFIEQTVHQPHLPDKISFALVDLDFYEPIQITLNYLASHLSVGGYVVVDDYGAFSTGAQIAVDEFAAERKDDFSLELPPASFGHFAILTRHTLSVT